MSIDRCSRCGGLVDTDNEPEAYVQIADMRKREEWICLCRRHREQWEEEHDAPEPPDLDSKIAAFIAANPQYSCSKCDWDVDGCTPCEAHAD